MIYFKEHLIDIYIYTLLLYYVYIYSNNKVAASYFIIINYKIYIKFRLPAYENEFICTTRKKIV